MAPIKQGIAPSCSEVQMVSKSLKYSYLIGMIFFFKTKTKNKKLFLPLNLIHL